MSKVETSELDRREIEKFTKHLIYKFVQIVVQSRLGARTVTRSKQLASSDWFNLSLPDRTDVRDATRAAFGDQLMSLVEPLCVEIALRTNENETMTLEYWYLQLTDRTTLPDSSFTVVKFIASVLVFSCSVMLHLVLLPVKVQIRLHIAKVCVNTTNTRRGTASRRKPSQ